MLSEYLSQINKNYLLQTCAHCKKKMQVSEGDVICGSKWYHSDCFIAWKQGCLNDELEET